MYFWSFYRGISNFTKLAVSSAKFSLQLANFKLDGCSAAVPMFCRI